MLEVIMQNTNTGSPRTQNTIKQSMHTGITEKFTVLKNLSRE
jgi:hypothetical protein